MRRAAACSIARALRAAAAAPTAAAAVAAEAVGTSSSSACSFGAWRRAPPAGAAWAAWRPAAAAAAAAARGARALGAQAQAALAHEEPAAPAPPAAGHERMTDYEIEVVTGDVRGAGSPAAAALTLVGEHGAAARFVFGGDDDAGGPFERATRRVFPVRARDLGCLQRLHVQQLAAAHSDVGVGWYLERVEVSTRGGARRWTFPCAAWLGGDEGGGGGGGGARGGGAAAGADAPEPRATERLLLPVDAAEVVLGDAGGSSLADPPLQCLVRPLRVAAAGVAVPHPEKVRPGGGGKGVSRRAAGHGGEDAYFIDAAAPAPGDGSGSAPRRGRIFGFGVADGVYMWRDQGIDSGEFSRALLAGCAAEVRAGGDDALRVLRAGARAARRAGARGSATACVVLVDAAQGRLAAANLGDSGFLLLGRPRAGGRAAGAAGGGGGGRALVPRYRSPQQEHSFGHPFQLGHADGADRPDDAMLSTMAVHPGDVLVLGSDGLWDNLSDAEVAAEAGAALLEGAPPAGVARRLAAAAFAASVDRGRETPYSRGATEAFDMVYSGGKMDDICVLVACVT